MKKHVRQTILITCLIMITVIHTGQAQDFAVVNSALILSEMPDVANMRTNLEAFAKTLQQKGQAMVTQYQNKETDAARKKEMGELSPTDEKRIIKELEQQQAEILAFEKEMQEKLPQKEQELLQPILERVNDAIKLVAQEKGLKMILDVSSGAILYVDNAIDLSQEVKSKLGL